MNCFFLLIRLFNFNCIKKTQNPETAKFFKNSDTGYLKPAESMCDFSRGDGDLFLFNNGPKSLCCFLLLFQGICVSFNSVMVQQYCSLDKTMRTLQRAKCAEKINSLKTVFIMKSPDFSAQLCPNDQKAAPVVVSTWLWFCAVSALPAFNFSPL